MRPVRLVSHMYWHRKHQFALEHDTYEYWTMFVPEEGSFAFRIGEHTGEASAGDVVLCPPKVPFHRRVAEPVSFHFIHLEPETDPLSPDMPAIAGRWTFQDKHRLASTCQLLHGRGVSAPTDRELLASHAVNDLWLWMLLERMPESSGQAGDSLPRSGDPLMDRAREFIARHACETLHLRELAGRLNMTPVQLTRRFRAAFATTPIDYVTQLRLERTCRLLEETSLSLEQIAPQCGYENGYYLSRVFSRKKGMTPSAYRKLHRI
ncbi:Helix-turn-helix domain-containing protein [Paenibacillus sp. UNCCL117]|uniref:AraC family transcriptional regulator n=1 Tax=unclassified Paenibacillus TaxID=185978 RepID=UPI0008865457|nr:MULTISPECIES: AraC family transcriptional regulator [unclassified Paenibacillus]SDD65175.1 Helix-turn-helix domain-containing protein [Paenibacillus sp. cl123]SFW58174.1 Helix-turn-helix domain-containing protein [Paenibacillus sp. UNCCL117]